MDNLLIFKAKSLDIDSLLKLLGAQTILLKSGSSAKLEQKNRGNKISNTPFKNWFCEISWGCDHDYDEMKDAFIVNDPKTSVDFATNSDGDSSAEAIAGCIYTFISCWNDKENGLSDQEKGIIVAQGFDSTLLG